MEDKLTFEIDSLKELDKTLDKVKEDLYKRKTLEISDSDLVVIQSINNKFNDIIGFINYLGRNQRELGKTTRNPVK